MRDTRWIYKNSSNEIYNNFNLDKDITTLLYNRDIIAGEDIKTFLYGGVEDITSPFLLKDIDKAVERLEIAKEKGEPVWIYGDYDVDGITSVSLCYLALKELGYNVKYYIPLRDEGYGLNIEALNYIKSEGGTLVITVDCGISSHKEIAHANEIGIDIIVTDHHEINSGNPPAFAVINPKREDNEYKFKYLAGVGTAFFLISALFEKNNLKDELYKYLDIVAIGTVADIVPLLKENRIFVKEGLEYLRRSKWLGINMLIKKIFEDYETRKFNTYDIGFIIAPIFNAAGRLEDAKRAVELFIERDHRVCSTIISELLSKNSERKEIQEDIFQKAVEKIENEKLYENAVLIVGEEGFHHGVIGIVASKILDRYYKPTIIMEIKKDEGIATASCRSIEGFNIIEALNNFSDLLLKYGGHSGAAGFSIKIENIPEFSKKLNEYAGKTISDIAFVKPIKIDKPLAFYKISYDFLDKISLLEPFGFGNSSPIFSLTNCQFDNLRLIGKDRKHIMLNIIKDGYEFKNCVWFNSDDIFEELVSLTNIDIAFKLKLETFKDKYQYKIFIEDIKESINIENSTIHNFDLYDTTFPIETVIYTRRKLESNELKLAFSDAGITVANNKMYLGTLDNSTEYLLTSLKNMYSLDFNVKLKDVIMKDENYNIHILIDKAYSFKSYAIKQGELFKDIKNFLIQEFQYNSIQKKILASIFKEKKNTVAYMKRGRGVQTIIQTIGLYFKNINERALLITDESINQKTLSCIDISNKYSDNFDFYILLNPTMDMVKKVINKRFLIISEENNLNIENIEIIKDSFSIPENIIFSSENEILNRQHIFSKKLTYEEKKTVIKNLSKYKTIYSTEDILCYL
ncbi:MAG: single-stranded-DNA-specific exonuclease RecJ [Fusobacterium sp.]|uniref:single-stranded-DNA-specific exonuclease RecJ n=1 Tax=Fusobacterium sp. TaxID=68766 RepID=UPI0029423117|nr:single-stranded-DNA-specific exonuclease RecJ [Fusobacterium sp.]MDY3059404.1 single-stranded-DNA-specific exonuclease RecJ [Fusobacterium sp.]